MRHALAVKERAAGDLVRAALNVNRGRPAASVGQGTRLPLNQPARTSSKASPLGRPQVRTEAGGVGAGIHPADRKVLEGRKGDPRRCANEALVQAWYNSPPRAVAGRLVATRRARGLEPTAGFEPATC